MFSCFKPEKFMNVAILGQVLEEIQEPMAILDKNYLLSHINRAMVDVCCRFFPGFNQIGDKAPVELEVAIMQGQANFCTNDEAGNKLQLELKLLESPLGELEGILMKGNYNCSQHTTELLPIFDLALQQSANKLAAIAYLDLDLKILSVNQILAQAIRYDREALIGLNLEDIAQVLKPGDGCMSKLYNALKTQHSWRDTVKFLFSGSTPTWMDVVVEPVYNDALLIGYTLIAFDVTLRKMKERAAQERESFFRSILENLPVGLQQISPKGWHVDMNLSMRNILGPGHAATIGQPYNIYQDSMNQRNGLQALLKEVIDSRSPHKREILLKYTELPDQDITRIQPTYFEATGFPVFDDKGEISFVFLIMAEITEKKLAELSLEKSERLLNTIVEHLPIGYIQIDNLGYIRRTNQTQRLLFGEESLPLDVVMNHIQQDPTCEFLGINQLFGQVLLGGKMVKLEKQLKNNGSIPWARLEDSVYLEITMFAVEDPVDKDQLVIILCDDVTKKKNQELEIAKNQEFLLQTGEIGKIGGWELDIGNKEMKWSEQTYKVVELPSFVPVNIEKAVSFYTPESQLQLMQAARECLDSGSPFDLQLGIVTAKKNSIRVRTIGQPEYADGKIIRVHGVIQDVTEIHEVRNELMRHTEIMRLFFDTIDLGYALMAADGTVNFMNKKAGEILDTESVIGKNIFDVFPWLVGTTFHSRVKECVAKQAPVSFFNYLPELDTWYEFLLAPMDDGSISIFTRNITYSKKLQRELRKANDQLSNLNKYLVNQNKQLEDFAHITSHNLRAPIANLKALLQLHKDSGSPEEKEMYIHMLDEVIMKIDETLNDLVEVIQIRKDLNVEQEKLSFAERLQKVKEILLVDIEQSGIQLLEDFQAAPTIEYPKIYLDSLLQNLLTNAIKYRSTDRQPSVHFKAWHEDGVVKLTVEDNGIGIDMQRYGNKIFGFRKTFHKNKDAKGIGLFITKSQVEAMGGQIKVESEPGVGTKFIITFRPE